MKIRILTYNVHSCRDADGKNSLNQIAEILSLYQPHIAGLNEIERNSPRTLFVNQPLKLAEVTKMNYLFGPTIKLGPWGFFGNSLLAAFPILEWHNLGLFSKMEPRACLRAVVSLPAGPLTVLFTHLGLDKSERGLQLESLIEIIKNEDYPVILMGDFNAPPEELTCLQAHLRDIGADSGPTFPATGPTARIDYIFVSKDIIDYKTWVAQTNASDHRPVIADIEV